MSGLRQALADLVWLKDGPKDGDYYEAKDAAWQTARDALAAHPDDGVPVDREALHDLLTRHWFEYIGEEEGFDCGCNEHGTLPGMPTVTEAASHLTDAVLALLNGRAS